MATIDKQLSPKESDIRVMVAAEVHFRTKNCKYQMERYVFKQRNVVIYIFNLEIIWEKLQMAAKVIVAVENPQDIIVVDSYKPENRPSDNILNIPIIVSCDTGILVNNKGKHNIGCVFWILAPMVLQMRGTIRLEQKEPEAAKQLEADFAALEYGVIGEDQ
ncbi:unnamed protein product [Arabidopsis arenosa]|uniref:40S ribosomal protein SA n=1 Tax=Arabidopsis arenosa TaxID=38785 RepID=A0A8S2A4A7_ARAAE|nr:unnamed protein product [Arabidopsis arenosa]